MLEKTVSIFAQVEGHLIVMYITINKLVMVDNTENEIQYIKTNPINLECLLTIWVKLEDGESKPLCIELLDSIKSEIIGDQFKHMKMV